MNWLVQNAGVLYVLLAVVAGGCVVAWRFNQQVKFLLYAAGVLALLAALWVTVRFVPSDRMQIEANVHAMADAIVAGKVDEIFKHVSNDFSYKSLTREGLYAAARKSIQANKVTDVRITAFTIEELSRTTKLARTRFRVSVWATGNDQPYLFVTQADFTLESEAWKLKTMRFYNPYVNQDQEMDLPGLR